MAISQTDYMDFGNGIIGDDTFDVWRKKTNRIQVNLDEVNVSLNSKIDTLFAQLPTTYVALGSSGSATAQNVYTSLSLSGKTQIPNATSASTALTLGTANLYTSGSVLKVDEEFDSSVQLTSTKVQAKVGLILGTKEYVIPQSPGVNNAILTSTTGGALDWKSAATLLQLTGGNVTTNVFEQPMPVGTVIATAGPISDSNYVLCDGQEYPQSQYPDLYAVIQNTYGTPQDSSKFKVPNYQGRIPVGQGVAGGVTFASDSSPFGTTGGDQTVTTDTADHTLTISDIPAHAHKFFDDRGNQHLALSDNNLTASGDAVASQGPNEGGNGDTGVEGTTYTGGGAAGGIAGGNTTDGDLSSLSGTTGHSHGISLTTGNRLQPYITTQYFIKAIKNNKADFKINIQNSGLISTDISGGGQTLIEPVDGTVTLKIKTDTEDTGITENSIRVDGTNLRIASSPYIQGSPIIRGVDLKHYNDIRAGGIAFGSGHLGRIGVHGNGLTSVSSTNTNHNTDYDRAFVPALADEHGGTANVFNEYGRAPSTGKGANNDTYIINYTGHSPNAVGDFTGGVVINGTRTIAFQDGTFLESANPRGPVKKLPSNPGGKEGNTMNPGEAFGFIDHDNQPRFSGHNLNKRFGGISDGTDDVGSNNGDGYCRYWNCHPLPFDEEADQLFMHYGSSHVLTKTGKLYAVGRGYTAGIAVLGITTADASSSEWNQWARAGCESDLVKFKTVTLSSEITNEGAFNALDENGYLWGGGRNDYRNLAVGGTNSGSAVTQHTYNETTGGAIQQKRDALAYPSLGENRIKVPHVMNPLCTVSSNAMTTDVTQSDLKIKTTFIDSVSFGMNHAHAGGTFGVSPEIEPNYDGPAGTTGGRVYHAGYAHYSQAGHDTSTNYNSGTYDRTPRHQWGIVQTAAGVDLTNVKKVYVSGEDNINTIYAITRNGSLYAWGYNSYGQCGVGNYTTEHNKAQLSWDSTQRGVGVKEIYVRNAHSSQGGGEGGSNGSSGVWLLTDEENPRIFVVGGFERGGHGQGGTTAARKYNTWIEITKMGTGAPGGNYGIYTGEYGELPITNYKILKGWVANGEDYVERFFVLARNITSNKTGLFVVGEGIGGELGLGDRSQYGHTHDTSYTTQFARVPFSPKLCERIVDIRTFRTYNRGYGATFIQLDDGRMYHSGRMVSGDEWKNKSMFTPVQPLSM